MISSTDIIIVITLTHIAVVLMTYLNYKHFKKIKKPNLRVNNNTEELEDDMDDSEYGDSR